MNPNKNKNEEMPPPTQKGKVLTGSETMEPAPRFLLVKKLEGDFSKMSPFLISRTLYGLIGETKDARKVKDGLLVETVSKAQTTRLLQIKRFGEDDVEVTPHGTLNYSKGVIYCKDLLNCSLEEILEGLKNQGVINVARIKTKQEGNLVDTPNHILTFNTPKLPTSIKAAFYNLKVRPYIPSPMRCFRCQMFGHTAIRCKRDQVCVCGKSLHEGKPCDVPIVCINCNGTHSARSKNCPKYKIEQAIQEIRTVERIPYNEAKKKVIVSTPREGVSYAQACQPKNLSEIIAELTPQITNIVRGILNNQSQQALMPFA